MFMIGDHVSYVGQKYKLAGKLGIVISRVINNPSELVVEFDESYVMHESLLARPQHSQPKEKGAEVRKKRADNEPMIKEEKPRDMRVFISEDDQKYAD